MYKVIQKHKNYAGIWLAVGCMALAFCFMFGKDTIETEYYSVLNKYYPPSTIDYICYFTPRVLVLVSIYFGVSQLKKI